VGHAVGAGQLLRDKRGGAEGVWAKRSGPGRGSETRGGGGGGEGEKGAREGKGKVPFFVLGYFSGPPPPPPPSFLSQSKNKRRF